MFVAFVDNRSSAKGNNSDAVPWTVTGDEGFRRVNIDGVDDYIVALVEINGYFLDKVLVDAVKSIQSSNHESITERAILD